MFYVRKIISPEETAMAATSHGPITAGAEREGAHTWVLPRLDPDSAVSATVVELRNAGADKAADRIIRRLRPAYPGA
jgi:hypothetical protein